MKKYIVLFCIAGFLRVIADEAPSDSVSAISQVAPIDFNAATEVLRNLDPEQQKDFENYLKVVEDLYGKHDAHEAKVVSSAKKDDDTEGFLVEESTHLKTFKDIKGDLPDGILLTVQLLKKRDQQVVRTEEVAIRKNTTNRLLLYGPPGTGKTTIAEALAHEMNSLFIRVSGTAFIDGYIATGTSRIHKLFKKARDLNKRVVVFIDEVDAIARERTKERNDEYANTLVALIQELDACQREASDRVFIVLATNKFGTLDEALRSRFSNTAIEIKTPTSAVGLEIMEFYLNRYEHEPISWGTLWWIKFWARGFSCRDYENMVDKAFVFSNGDVIKKEHILKALNEAYAARKSGESEKDSWIKKISDKYSTPWSSSMSAISYTSAAWMALYGVYKYVNNRLYPEPMIDPLMLAITQMGAQQEKILTELAGAIGKLVKQ